MRKCSALNKDIIPRGFAAGNNEGTIKFVTYTVVPYNDEWTIAKIGYMSETATLEGQQTGSWCWAAAARMFAKQDSTNFNVNKSQDNAALYVFDKHYAEQNPDKDHQTFGLYDVGDALRAINYYRNIEQTAAFADGTDLLNDQSFATLYENQTFSETQLLSFLNQGQAIYISRLSFNSALPGHAILIYGYVIIDGDYWYLIRDPWPVNTVNPTLCCTRDCSTIEMIRLRQIQISFIGTVQ